MSRGLARVFGCTDGQVYTLVTGLAVALPLTLAGTHTSSSESFARSAPLQLSPAAPNPVVAVSQPPAAPPVQPPTLPVPILADGPVQASAPAADTPVPSPTRGLPSIRPIVFARIGRPGAPGGVAVGSDGRVFVPTNNGTSRGVPGPSKVFAFDTAGHQVAAIGVGGQPQQHADGLGAVAVDPVHGSVYVVNLENAKIMRVDPVRGSGEIAATVPDLPPCLPPIDSGPCEPGVVDRRPIPAALAFDNAGDLFIADAGQATIWRWRTTDRAPMAWYQSADLATGDGPAGLTFDRSGHLVFSVGSTLDLNNLEKGGLYGLNINADGSAGARALLASFSSSDRPGAVVAATSGVVYIILRGPGTIEVVRSGTAKPFPTSGSSVPLDGPSGLAVLGQRLLISNESTSNDAAHWAVLSFPLIP